MKYLVDIPDEYDQYAGLSREKLYNETVLGMRHADFYGKVMKTGSPVYAHQTLNPTNGTRKALLLPDLHIPDHDEAAVDAAISHGVKIGVDTIVVTGDGVDLYGVSNWPIDPLKPMFLDELERSREVLEKIMGCFPKDTERVWIDGNHEDRMRRHIWKESRKLAGLEALEVKSLYGLDSLGFNYVNNKQLKMKGLKPFMLGKLAVLHGHELPTSHKNKAEGHYVKAPGSQVCGHHHRRHEFIVPKVDGKLTASWVMGCLCNKAPEYAPFSRFEHGYGIVEWDSEGNFEFQNVGVK